jgi:predicted HTH transcriptional regulator
MVIDFQDNNEYKKKIFLYHETIDDRLISRESGWLEFKESFNWNAKDKYAKSMAAFANNKGGFIVFGIKDKPRDLVGLRSNNFEEVEVCSTGTLSYVFLDTLYSVVFCLTQKI